jgi:hypothetical protein
MRKIPSTATSIQYIHLPDERFFWQEKSSAGHRCQRASPKHQNVTPGQMTQDPG